MKLPSARIPLAAILGAALMAWRAYEIAPQYTAVLHEMIKWIMLGGLLLIVGTIYELVRLYLLLDGRYGAKPKVC